MGDTTGNSQDEILPPSEQNLSIPSLPATQTCRRQRRLTTCVKLCSGTAGPANKNISSIVPSGSDLNRFLAPVLVLYLDHQLGFPSGDYFLDGNVFMKSGVELEGRCETLHVSQQCGEFDCGPRISFDIREPFICYGGCC